MTRPPPRPPWFALLLVFVVACGAPSLARDTTESQPRATAPSQPSRPILREGDATIDLVIEGSTGPIPRAALVAWTRRAARMVIEYYGRYPVPTLEVKLVMRSGGGIGFGQHWNGRRIRIFVGRDTTAREMERDWVMVHEMLHAAFPSVDRDRHRWMQEGLSTYLESVVRARAGVLSDEAVWSRWVRYMPHGLPRSGDRGLDHTHTWGRTYWGGALFWLLADVRIRERTGGRRSLRDALRAVLEAGGNARSHWSTRRIVAVGDRATGTRVLRELYDEMAQRPGTVDLPSLWSRLGLVVSGERVRGFDDEAPLAAVRRAIDAKAHQL